MKLLAIDVGSSSVKAALWEGRRFRAVVRAGFKTVFDGVKVEVPTEGVLRAMERVVREAAPRRAAVDAIAFCAFSSSVVVADQRSGKVRAGAITHQDRRSIIEAKSLCRSIGKRWLLAHTGNLPYPGGIGSSTLAWLRGTAGEVLAGDYRVGQLSTLIGWVLTGQWVIDPSNAAFLGLWDIRTGGWSERMCNAVGVSAARLPRVLPADQIIGHVTPSAASAFGLKTGTPVLGGFVDGSAGVMLTCMQPGQLVHNSGSTDVLAMCMRKPQPMEGILTRPVGVGNVFPERWLAVRTIAAAGSALDWARRVMFSEMTETRWQRTLRRCIDHANIEDDLICVPSFAGERATIEQRRGALFGNVSLASGREQILKAIVRGLTLQSGLGYDALAKLHKPARVVYELGGADALRKEMQRNWSGKHVFRELQGDGLRGLVELARRAIG